MGLVCDVLLAVKFVDVDEFKFAKVGRSGLHVVVYDVGVPF